MQTIFTLLLATSFFCLVAGLIKPSGFQRFTKSPITRKKLLIIFGTLFFISLVLSRPADVKNKNQSNAQNSTNESNAELPIQPATQTASSTLESKITSDKQIQKNDGLSETPLANKKTITDSNLYSVFSVVDGDTIKVNIDGKTETLRLIGIDTPETLDPRKPVQCFGKEASDKAKQLLIGQKVRLAQDSSQGERDKYNRLLAYVYRDDGLFYNKYMIEEGYAHEYTYHLPYMYQVEFKAAQKSAMENLKGLWSPTTCNGDTTSDLTVSTSTLSVSTTQNLTGVATSKYYTSSHYSSKYYYPEACLIWKNLSAGYLKTFNTLDELLKAYPSKTLSPQCQ